MKTAVDTSVRLDVLSADTVFGETSREALRKAYDSGALIASDVVWAEVRADFLSQEPFYRRDRLPWGFDSTQPRKPQRALAASSTLRPGRC